MRVWIVALLGCGLGCGQAPHGFAVDAHARHRDAMGADAARADAGIDAGAGVDASGVDASVADAGGAPDAGSTCPAGTWCAEAAPIPSTTLLGAVWAVDADDVFAVGDGGAIILRHDGAWTKMTSNTTANLRGVWGASTSDVWAVGTGGAVVHYDGSTWSAVTGLTTVDLAAVWGSSGSDVWAVGPSTVLHWNGSTWSSTSLAGTLLSVSGTGPSDVWVCGETAYVRHYTGTWSGNIVPIAGNTDYWAIAAGPAGVWTTSAYPDKQMLRLSGTTWTPYAATGAVFQALYEVGASEVWAVGTKGNIGHWTGSTWSLETPAGTVSLYGVTGAGGAVWVVGAGATILYRH